MHRAAEDDCLNSVCGKLCRRGTLHELLRWTRRASGGSVSACRAVCSRPEKKGRIAYQNHVARMCDGPALPLMTSVEKTTCMFLCSQPFGARSATIFMYFSWVRKSPAAMVPYDAIPEAMMTIFSVLGSRTLVMTP